MTAEAEAAVQAQRTSERFVENGSFTPEQAQDLNDFVDYVFVDTGVDMLTAGIDLAPVISHAAHDYLSKRVNQQIDAIIDSDTGAADNGSEAAMPHLRAVPPPKPAAAEKFHEPLKGRVVDFGDGQLIVSMAPAPIDRFIGDYYREYPARLFGKFFDKTDVRAIHAAAHITINKNPIFKPVYRDVFIIEGEPATRVYSSREQDFPEIGHALALQEMLDDRGYHVPVISLDVVLAGFGNRFLNFASEAGRRVVGESGLIQPVDEQAIPPDLRAENPDNYQPRQ